jgi:hypothetical protein
MAARSASNSDVNPELLGGIRVKVGSDVWDGSVKARLEALSDSSFRLVPAPQPFAPSFFKPAIP